MEAFSLRKHKKNLLISRYSEEFDDSYSRVHITDKTLDYLKVPRNVFIISQDTSLGKDLMKYFVDINRLKEKSKTPNKVVYSDVIGTSKLIRNLEKGYIEISKRYVRKDGTTSLKVTSPNMCFISDSSRSDFFKDVEQYSNLDCLGKKGNKRYIITLDMPVYDYWSTLMNSEYKRLSGIDLAPIRNNQPKIDDLDRWIDLVGKIGKSILSQNLKEFFLHNISSYWSVVDTSLYNKYDEFIDYLDILDKGSIWRILKPLTTLELESIYLDYEI